MHGFLERLGRICARWHWVVIAAWIVIVGGLLVVRGVAGGEFNNNYSVPGSQSNEGLDKLDAAFPQAGGYAGQIVFEAPEGKQISASADAINQSVADVSKLDHVLSAVSPFDVQNSPQVSKDGRIAYATVQFDVLTDSLDSAYEDNFHATVEKPLKNADLRVEYGGYAGQINSETDDQTSEAIGLACALVLLLFMFGS